jgi:hypothetical protein
VESLIGVDTTVTSAIVGASVSVVVLSVVVLSVVVLSAVVLSAVVVLSVLLDVLLLLHDIMVKLKIMERIMRIYLKELPVSGLGIH